MRFELPRRTLATSLLAVACAASSGAGVEPQAP